MVPQDQLLRSPLECCAVVAWVLVGAIRRESTREERGLKSCRDENEGREPWYYSSWEGARRACYLCDPASELELLVGRRESRAKIKKKWDIKKKGEIRRYM